MKNDLKKILTQHFLNYTQNFYTVYVSSYIKHETNCIKPVEYVNGNYQQNIWHK